MNESHEHVMENIIIHGGYVTLLHCDAVTLLRWSTLRSIFTMIVYEEMWLPEFFI